MLSCKTSTACVKVCEAHFKVEHTEDRICCGLTFCTLKMVIILTNNKLAIPEEESYVCIVVNEECQVVPFVFTDADESRINFCVCKSCLFKCFICLRSTVHTGRTDSKIVLCICYNFVFILIFDDEETCCIFDKGRTEPEYHCVMVTCFTFHFSFKLRETIPNVNVYCYCRVLSLEIIDVEVCTCFGHTCKVENCEVIGVNDTGNFNLCFGSDFRSCLSGQPKHILSLSGICTVIVINYSACLGSPRGLCCAFSCCVSPFDLCPSCVERAAETACKIDNTIVSVHPLVYFRCGSCKCLVYCIVTIRTSCYCIAIFAVCRKLVAYEIISVTCLKASLVTTYCTCFRLCTVSCCICMLMIICASIIFCCRKCERVRTITCCMVVVHTMVVNTVTPFKECTIACCQAVLTVEKHCSETKFVACFCKEVSCIVDVFPRNSDLILCCISCTALFLRICYCVCRTPIGNCLRLTAKVRSLVVFICFAYIFKNNSVRNVDIAVLCFGDKICFNFGIRVINHYFVRIVSVRIVTNDCCTAVTCCVSCDEVGNIGCELNTTSDHGRLPGVVSNMITFFIFTAVSVVSVSSCVGAFLVNSELECVSVPDAAVCSGAGMTCDIIYISCYIKEFFVPHKIYLIGHTGLDRSLNVLVSILIAVFVVIEIAIVCRGLFKSTVCL